MQLGWQVRTGVMLPLQRILQNKCPCIGLLSKEFVLILPVHHKGGLQADSPNPCHIWSTVPFYMPFLFWFHTLWLTTKSPTWSRSILYYSVRISEMLHLVWYVWYGSIRQMIIDGWLGWRITRSLETQRLWTFQLLTIFKLLCNCLACYLTLSLTLLANPHPNPFS